MLQERLEHFFGFNQFRDKQERIIQSILDGQDTFVLMPTGGGKSLCYQLPALMSEGVALVVSPLIALMKNQVDSVRSHFTEDSIAHVLNSSLTKTELNQVHADLLADKTKLLYIAPETLNKEENVVFFSKLNISFVAIDEAHCISEWGHDFRPDYREMKRLLQALNSPPMIALTATATPKVQEDIVTNLGMRKPQIFKSSFNRPNLFYEIRPKTSDINKDIVRFVKKNEGKSGIIYCMSRKKVEEVSELLQLNGIRSIPYHAGYDTKKRRQYQDDFIMERVQVVVATIAFGMGIDKPDIRFVIHHDIPKSIESYYQETGRAGRDGGEGHCLAFYRYEDIEKMEKMSSDKPLAEQELSKFQIQEMMAYAETSMCRRKYLLHYFGEDFDEEHGPGAKMDDNATKKIRLEDAQEQVLLFLEAVKSAHGLYRSRDLIQIIVGNTNALIDNQKGYNLPCFGKGKAFDASYWRAIHRQTLVKGLIHKRVELFGNVELTDVGAQFIDKPEVFMLVRDHNFEEMIDETENEIKQRKKATYDKELYQRLIAKRNEIAHANKIPPYTVFSEQTIQEMAAKLPQSTDMLRTINGMNVGKVNRYAEAILPIIQRHLSDLGIYKEEETLVVQAANKSAKKSHTLAVIKAVDRMTSIVDIADNQKLSILSVIEEMEKIVIKGSKLDIRYILDTYIDDEQQQEIYDYLMEEEIDDVQELIEEFDGEYEEEELRLMRIRFLNEVAN